MQPFFFGLALLCPCNTIVIPCNLAFVSQMRALLRGFCIQPSIPDLAERVDWVVELEPLSPPLVAAVLEVAEQRRDVLLGHVQRRHRLLDRRRHLLELGWLLGCVGIQFNIQQITNGLPKICERK